MTKQVQRRRGTATQHTSFTGAEGEISVNTTNKSVHVHDGTTAGGIEAARADLTNVTDANLNAALAGNTLSSLTITSADINGGTIDGTVIGGTTPAAITGTTGTFSGNLAVDTNTLYVDAASNNVGIGTSSPNADLELGGVGEVLRLSGSSTNAYIRNTDGTTNQWYIGSGGVAGLQHYIYAAQPMTFHTNGTERLRIDASGNVGVGTTDPTTLGGGSKLTVNQGADGNIVFARGGSTRQVQLGTSSTMGYINADNASGGLGFNVNGSERARIDSSGSLLVGTTSTVDSSKLYVVGGISQSGSQFNFRPGSGVNYEFVNRDGAGFDFYVNNASNLAARIDASGNLLVGTTTALEKFTCGGRASFAGYIYPTTDNAHSCGLNGNRWSAIWAANGTIQTSDQRDKTEIVESPLGLDFVLALEPVAYKFKVGKNLVGEDGQVTPVAGTRQHFGLIAQQVKEVCGEVDFGGWIKTDPEDSESAEGLRYDQFIAPLIKAVQEQQAQIEDLKDRVTALEA